MMNRDRSHLKELQDALLDAFPTRPDLERMVWYGLNQDLSVITNNGNLQQAVFELIRWSMTHGKLELLVNVALQENSQNLQLIHVAQQLALRNEQDLASEFPSDETTQDGITYSSIDAPSTPEKKPLPNLYRIPALLLSRRSTRLSIAVSIVSSVVAASMLVLSGVGAFALLSYIQNDATTRNIGPCGGAVSDEFNSSVNARWQWIDPSGNATHNVVSAGRLRIATPTNSDLFPPSKNYNAPRMLQPISGNFTVETSVEFHPDTNYQGAGILVWQDENNFLRFEQGYNGSNQIGLSTVETGQFRSVANSFTNATQVKLRIQKDGNTLTASWRLSDQDEWQPVGVADLHLDNAMVGLILAAQYSQGSALTTAYYNYFRVTCASR